MDSSEPNTLQRLLGLPRINHLRREYAAAHSVELEPVRSSFVVLIAILIAVLPGFAYKLRSLTSELDIPTILIAASAAFAIVYRRVHGIGFGSVASWRKSLSLTHTAFALGCIPAVFLVIASPQALYQLSQSAESVPGGSAAAPGTLRLLALILGTAVWAGLTEEIIYRGLLVSILRRWNIIESQRLRDSFAVILSASIFGLIHLTVWGPQLSLALIGVGIGFRVAYIAIGERLLPVILYHIIFDLLSLSLALFRNGFN